MNKKLRESRAERRSDKSEITPQKQRLHFILLRVFLLIACIAVSVGIWLAVHYVEHLKTQEQENTLFAYVLTDRNALIL